MTKQQYSKAYRQKMVNKAKQRGTQTLEEFATEQGINALAPAFTPDFIRLPRRKFICAWAKPPAPNRSCCCIAPCATLAKSSAH